MNLQHIREKLWGKPLPNHAWRMGCIPRAFWFAIGLFTIRPAAYVSWAVLLAVVVLSMVPLMAKQ